MALIPVREALHLIKSAATAGPTSTIPLRHAVGYTLAKDVSSRTTLPPLDVSAMDGYAVTKTGNLKSGSMLTVIGESPAGEPYRGNVHASETVRIFTGGAVPKGTDHVIIQENVSRDGNQITLT